MSSIQHQDDSHDSDADFHYAFVKQPELGNIFAKYDFPNVSAEQETMQVARRVMQWIADPSTYDGGSLLGPSLPERMLEYSLAVSNETGEPTQDGVLCTTIGLMDICVFQGNDFSYRYHWEEQFHFLPHGFEWRTTRSWERGSVKQEGCLCVM